jgi:prepilin-type N-terminal cleavage/methylation domain-containing protein
MNKKGFTLIEIIIVIVILGVLATLALPRLTAQVTAAEAAEAMQFFGPIKRAAMNCYDSTGNFGNCNTQAKLQVTVPGGARFTYFQNAPTTASVILSIWARSNANTANFIMMNIDGNGRTLFATPVTGPYIGIVNRTLSTTVVAAVPAGAF